MVKEFIKLAWRNIWRNKRRSFIMMSSIAFAVLLSCMMMSVQYGTLEHMIDNVVRFYMGHIQIHNDQYWDEKVIDNSLDYDEQFLEQLESIPHTVAIVPRIESFALSAFKTRTKGAMVLGIDPVKEQGIMDPKRKLVAGNYFKPDDKSVILGEGLADYLGLSIRDSVVLISQGYHGASAIGLYPVVGMVKFPNPDLNNQMVCMPLKEAQWFYGLGQRVSSIALLMNSKDDVATAKTTLQTFTKEIHAEPMDWNEMMPELQQTVNMKVENGKIMMMVLYIVIGFGMFGTFLMMTAERTYEFGISIAIGMKRIWLQFTIFLEIIMMSLMGVLGGVTISIITIIYFHFNPVQLGTKMADMYESYGFEAVIKFALRSEIFVWQAWAVFIIGFVLSFYPLIVLRKIKPVEAMRNS